MSKPKKAQKRSSYEIGLGLYFCIYKYRGITKLKIIIDSIDTPTGRKKYNKDIVYSYGSNKD